MKKNSIIEVAVIATPHFYVAIQIIGKYLLFINCYISNSYTILREYDDF